jgi:hypothetical protein
LPHSRQKPKAPQVTGKTNFDVAVTHTNQTTLFKIQNRKASQWLREHYSWTVENGTGDTEIRVHLTRYKRIIDELKATGFEVLIL